MNIDLYAGLFVASGGALCRKTSSVSWSFVPSTLNDPDANLRWTSATLSHVIPEKVLAYLLEEGAILDKCDNVGV